MLQFGFNLLDNIRRFVAPECFNFYIEIYTIFIFHSRTLVEISYSSNTVNPAILSFSYLSINN